MTMSDVDQSVFRQLCGYFATGVAVVTTTTPRRTPVGMTANSFSSVSLDPPLVSVCIDHQADMHRHLLEADRFVINLLESRQEALSRRFAEERADRFEGVGFRLNRDGIPVLEDTLATIECERHSSLQAGDHTIVIGRVVGGAPGSGRPLLFYRGGYVDGVQG